MCNNFHMITISTIVGRNFQEIGLYLSLRIKEFKDIFISLAFMRRLFWAVVRKNNIWNLLNLICRLMEIHKESEEHYKTFQKEGEKVIPKSHLTCHSSNRCHNKKPTIITKQKSLPAHDPHERYLKRKLDFISNLDMDSILHVYYDGKLESIFFQCRVESNLSR